MPIVIVGGSIRRKLFARTTIVEQILADRLEPDPRLPQVIGGRFAGPYDLPAGRYSVRVWFDDNAAWNSTATDEVWVAYHRGPGVLSRSPVTPRGPSEMTLDLPVTFHPLWVVASSEPVARAVTRVEIKPVSVVPRTSRSEIANIRQARVLADEAGAVRGVSRRQRLHGANWVLGTWRPFSVDACVSERRVAASRNGAERSGGRSGDGRDRWDA